jgi:hypothetical protein
MGKCAVFSSRGINNGMPITTSFRKGFTNKAFDFEMDMPEFSACPVYFLNKNCQKHEKTFGSLAIYMICADP